VHPDDRAKIAVINHSETDVQDQLREIEAEASAMQILLKRCGG
jgi:hypothetical protein